MAFLRGTTADAEGNVTMEHEAATLDSLSIAQATKTSGGIVIVQVERVTDRHTLPPRDVRIPGIFVDGVVVAGDGAAHVQTFAEPYNPAYVGEPSEETEAAPAPRLDPRTVIARRAARSSRPNSVVNIGIGIPEGVVGVARPGRDTPGDQAHRRGRPDRRCARGRLELRRGRASRGDRRQPYQFDFYDGAGLDQAFLGMAQVDRTATST